MLKHWRKEVFRRLRPSLEQLPQRDMPDSLKIQLQQIPTQNFLCRDTDRLWAAYLAHELLPEEAEGCRKHLAGCNRCSEIVRALAATRAEQFEPSKALLGRLREIPRSSDEVSREGYPQKTAPWWLLDLRYAAAVCSSLAVLAVALCGKPAECLAHTDTWTDPVLAVMERVEDGSQTAVRSFSQALRNAPYLHRKSLDSELGGGSEETKTGATLPDR